MAEIILITGGARSGKSRFAQELAESRPGPRLFLATCPVLDEEMAERIERHRRDRQDRGWQTIEEETDLAGVLNDRPEPKTVLIDCLTLWINNLLYRTVDAPGLTEDRISREAAVLIRACRARDGRVILVTNEVGSGVVPELPTARLYRDLAGRCNQEIAGAADELYLVVCGIPQEIKGVNHGVID